MRLRIAPIVIGLLANACTAEKVLDVVTFSERDSAGIAIATNSSSPESLSLAWTLDTTDALRIESVDSIAATHFNRISAIVLTSDGGILVGNADPPEIRVFDSNGKFVRTMGRSGDGPGEFRTLTDLFVGAADTIVASEHRFDFQISKFLAGRFVGESRVDNAAIAAALPPGMRRGDGHAHVFPSGAVMLSAALGKAPILEGESPPPGELTAVWVSADRKSARAMAKVQDMDIVMVGSRETLPLAPRVAKYGISAKHPARFCFANNRAPEVHCVDDDGSERIIRWRQPEVPIAQAEIDRSRTVVKDPRVIEALLTHTTYAPVVAVHVLVDHSVLVLTADFFSRTRLVFQGRLFSPKGELLGKVAFPPMFRPLYIESGRVAGVRRDEDRVEHVVVYRIAK